MFTYLNPEIRQRLIEQEKLVRVNSEGQIIDVSSPEHPGELAVNVMGPIPMPMSLPGVKSPCSGMPRCVVLSSKA